jgi:murein DD-endopeptidase MepM/ murein hydrolase activator NlpD
MTDRTLKLTDPHMHGDDVRAWQDTLNRQMRTWDVAHRVEPDGDYGAATRDLTSTVLFGLGIGQHAMHDGVPPALRIKVRAKQLTTGERARYAARALWRERLRKKWSTDAHVAPPLAKIVSSSWGWHPGVHDGVDLICRPAAPCHAICTGEVIRADAGGWWGLGAPADAAVRARGDGIVVVRCTINAGPFRPGLNFCYGHAEAPIVRVGDHVKAGDHIARAGFANAWHVHFMVNNRTDQRGVGDRDPMPYVDYACKHG